jgi:hypothetical protein
MKKKITLAKCLARCLVQKNRNKFRRIIWAYEGNLSENDRYLLLNAVTRESMKAEPDIDEVIRAINSVTRKAHTRDSKKIIKEQKSQKNIQHNAGVTGYVFFLCSKHKGVCAKDHTAYQGKIYVDRFWRSRVSDAGYAKRIQDYIDTHNIQTVQWVMHAPVYMCTRPNCKHKLIGVRIDDVLNKSLTELRKITPGAITATRNVTAATRARRKKEVHQIFESTLPKKIIIS